MPIRSSVMLDLNDSLCDAAVLTRRALASRSGPPSYFVVANRSGGRSAWRYVRGEFPNLALTMTRSSDGAVVTAADFYGRVVILYFGFTRCSEICPFTMHNTARVLQKMGPLASRVRVPFVTVDLAYDTVPRLKTYLANFGKPPGIDGLHGTPDQLAVLARRCRVA